MPRIVPPFVIHPLPASPFEVATTAAQALCRGCVPSLPVGTLTVGRRRSPRGTLTAPFEPSLPGGDPDSTVQSLPEGTLTARSLAPGHLQAPRRARRTTPSGRRGQGGFLPPLPYQSRPTSARRVPELVSGGNQPPAARGAIHGPGRTHDSCRHRGCGSSLRVGMPDAAAIRSASSSLSPPLDRPSAMSLSTEAMREAAAKMPRSQKAS